MIIDERRPTGSWNDMVLNVPDSFGQDRPRRDAAVFDPFVLVLSATARLQYAQWVGNEIMPTSLLFRLLDQHEDDAYTLIESWADANLEALADNYRARLDSYADSQILDELGRRALGEAIEAYRRRHFIAAVRAVIPEIERVGRVLLAPIVSKKTCKQIIIQLQDLIGFAPVSLFDQLESATAFAMLKRKLFASCFTSEEAALLGPAPNRHAELHGLANYGDIRGATTMIGVQNFLLQAIVFGERGIRAAGRPNVA